MSAPNIDKSLDDIIGSKPRRRFQRRKGGVVKKAAVAKKDVTKLKEKKSTISNSRRQPKEKVDKDDPFYQATKVTISNFPVDINEHKLKDFLAKDVGQVKGVVGVYAKNGKPTGQFTVEFANEGKALATFKKLNGMPMDNGAKILSVEIHSDPFKKSLASRLGGKPEEKKKADKPAGDKPQKKKKNVKAKRAPKVAKKTAEELDAEMDDYINQKDVISV